MNVILHTQKVTQNNQEYLLGVFKIEEILRFTRYTEYTILGFDEENQPITNKQVQRKLNSSKVESIANFLINDPQAIFPTNLVIAIPSHVISSYEEIDKKITIELDSKVNTEIDKIQKGEVGSVYLSIIDGQHRVRGIEIAIEKLEKTIGEESISIDDSSDSLHDKLQGLKDLELPVAFFIDPVLEYQAMIFSTINRTQTKVSQDLVYSLFGLTEDDSPQKTALNIVNALNGAKKSPFYKRIRLAGATSSKAAKDFYKDGYPILSQATMVKSILYMITKNSNEAEIERNKSRRYFEKHPNSDLLFRKYYANNQDAEIMKILYAYFSAIKNVFEDQNGDSYWEMKGASNKPTNILQTTIGYEALLELLKRILPLLNENQRFEEGSYKIYLSRAVSLDIKDDNDPKKYPFMNKTKKIFIKDLSDLIFNDPQ